MATAATVSPAPPLPKKASGSHFYKYASLEHSNDAEHNKRLGWLRNIILNHQLYVPDITELNDPAEGRPRLTPLSEDRLFSFLYSSRYGVLGRNPQLPPANQVLDAAILDANIRHHGPKTLMRIVSKILYEELKGTKIYCLSKRCNNMSMWAKYADGHCGYCLEFANEDDFFGQAMEVIYGDSVEFDITNDEYVGGWFFFCKGQDWSNEQEIRIRGSRTNRHEVKIDPRCLTRIILGWHMPEADRALIREWARQRKPELTVVNASWDECEQELRLGP